MSVLVLDTFPTLTRPNMPIGVSTLPSLENDRTAARLYAPTAFCSSSWEWTIRMNPKLKSAIHWLVGISLLNSFTGSFPLVLRLAITSYWLTCLSCTTYNYCLQRSCSIMPQPCFTAFLVCYVMDKSNKKRIQAQAANFVYNAEVRENNRAQGKGKVRHSQ